MVDFDPDVDQKLVVGTGAGQRILLGGIDEALCQRFVELQRAATVGAPQAGRSESARGQTDCAQ